MKKIFIISFICLLLDQIIKIIISNTMHLYESIKVINNFFYITSTKNTGAAFSMLLNGRYFLILISIVVLVIFFKYLKKINKFSKFETIIFGLIIGGILGNLIDRIIYGYVIDYLDFYIFNYDAPIFNLADSFICVGCILFIINNYLEGKNGNKNI